METRLPIQDAEYSGLLETRFPIERGEPAELGISPRPDSPPVETWLPYWPVKTPAAVEIWLPIEPPVFPMSVATAELGLSSRPDESLATRLLAGQGKDRKTVETRFPLPHRSAGVLTAIPCFAFAKRRRSTARPTRRTSRRRPRRACTSWPRPRTFERRRRSRTPPPCCS